MAISCKGQGGARRRHDRDIRGSPCPSKQAQQRRPRGTDCADAARTRPGERREACDREVEVLDTRGPSKARGADPGQDGGARYRGDVAGEVGALIDE